MGDEDGAVRRVVIEDPNASTLIKIYRSLSGATSRRPAGYNSAGEAGLARPVPEALLESGLQLAQPAGQSSSGRICKPSAYENEQQR
jgi:hypothetical protein